MRTFLTLLKREYWEHKPTFFWIPTIMGVILILLSLLTLTSSDWQFSPAGISPMPEQYKTLTLIFSQAIRVPFIPLFLFSIFAYSLGTLYEERKDKSILFWRSMPISDTTTVLSKLCTALFTLPLFYFIIIAIVQVIIIGILQLAIWYHHLPHGMAVSGIFRGWLLLASHLLLQSLLLFPAVAWAMLASIIAKRTPILYAITPLIIISLVEAILWQHSYFWTALRHYGFNAINIPVSANALDELVRFPNMASLANPLSNLPTILQQVPLFEYFAVGCLLSISIILLRKRAQ